MHAESVIDGLEHGLVNSVLVNATNLSQQIVLWYADIIKHNDPIINHISAIFRTNVSYSNARQHLVSLRASERNYEGVGTFRDAIYDQLSPDDSHSCILGCSADPKFHALLTLRSKDELAFLVIVFGKHFHAFVVAAVVELSQSKASDVLEFHSPPEPHFMCGVALEIFDGVRI